jgi:hypothetical protein
MSTLGWLIGAASCPSSAPCAAPRNAAPRPLTAKSTEYGGIGELDGFGELGGFCELGELGGNGDRGVGIGKVA